MAVRCKYTGKTEYYKVDGFSPIQIKNGQIYNIVYSSGVGKYKYIVYIINEQGKIITWIPYNVNPFMEYWLFID